MAYVSVHIDADKFDDDELADELRSRGYMVTKTGVTMDGGAVDLAYIEHLSLCGMQVVARQEALEMIGRAIGRSLAN